MDINLKEPRRSSPIIRLVFTCLSMDVTNNGDVKVEGVFNFESYFITF